MLQRPCAGVTAAFAGRASARPALEILLRPGRGARARRRSPGPADCMGRIDPGPGSSRSGVCSCNRPGALVTILDMADTRHCPNHEPPGRESLGEGGIGLLLRMSRLPEQKPFPRSRRGDEAGVSLEFWVPRLACALRGEPTDATPIPRVDTGGLTAAPGPPPRPLVCAAWP
jgi:hypothetical protein